jgi:hypothetical protein
LKNLGAYYYSIHLVLIPILNLSSTYLTLLFLLSIF